MQIPTILDEEGEDSEPPNSAMKEKILGLEGLALDLLSDDF
jgi:hypothetical protein